MADNYLERQQELLAQRKAGHVVKPADRRRFYTRPVVTSTHAEQQAAIAAAQHNVTPSSPDSDPS